MKVRWERVYPSVSQLVKAFDWTPLGPSLNDSDSLLGLWWSTQLD